MNYAISKMNFSVEKISGTESRFVKGKSYEYINRSNGEYVVRDNEGSAIQFSSEEFNDSFDKV